MHLGETFLSNSRLALPFSGVLRVMNAIEYLCLFCARLHRPTLLNHLIAQIIRCIEHYRHEQLVLAAFPSDSLIVTLSLEASTGRSFRQTIAEPGFKYFLF